jgi:hypothetical protein
MTMLSYIVCQSFSFHLPTSWHLKGHLTKYIQIAIPEKTMTKKSLLNYLWNTNRLETRWHKSIDHTTFLNLKASNKILRVNLLKTTYHVTSNWTASEFFVFATHSLTQILYFITRQIVHFLYFPLFLSWIWQCCLTSSANLSASIKLPIRS